MPTLSSDMIAEIEQTMEELVDRVNELERENKALLAQLQREKATPED
jgi:hypothetical protein